MEKIRSAFLLAQTAGPHSRQAVWSHPEHRSSCVTFHLIANFGGGIIIANEISWLERAKPFTQPSIWVHFRRKAAQSNPEEPGLPPGFPRPGVQPLLTTHGERK
jgi:hypothetical protein